jgi:hypothetical protein
MSDITDGIGSAVEGALTGKAVEDELSSSSPASDTAQDASAGECLNCGTALIGRHCHGCGQKASIHRSLKAIGHDLMHGVLHLDGKLWRTLPLLTIKPGRLTRRYIDGERAKFVSPMAMFLFSVFLMFAVFQAVGITTPTDLDMSDDVELEIEDGLERTERELEKSRAELAATPVGDPRRAELEQQISTTTQAIATAKDVRAAVKGEDGSSASVDFSGTGVKAIDDTLIKKWREDPGLMLYKLQTNAYKFSWLLIPLSIPFVWAMFFWKRRFKAYDHAIFVTYSLSFMSLLFVVLSVLGTIGAPTQVIVFCALLIPPVHIHMQLKNGYDLSHRQAFWRTMALCNGIVFVVISLFLWLLMLLGAL